MVQAAQGVSHRVDIAHAATGEGTACVEGSPLHLLSGFQVAAVLKHREDVVVNQLHGFLCQFVFQLGVVGVVGIGLYRMGEGIHPGGGSDVGRQAHRQLRVKHGIFGNQEGVVDGGLAVGGGVGDHRRNRGLGAGSSGGGNCYKGWDGPVNLQNPLELGNRLLGMYCLCGNALGAVHPGAAAQGYNGFAALFFVGFVAQLHIIAGGVGMVEGLHGVSDTGGIESIQHGLHHAPAQHPRFGDQQHIVQVLRLQKFPQLPDLAGAFQVLGHPIAQKIVAHLQHCLKAAAPDNFQFVRERHRFFLLSSGDR